MTDEAEVRPRIYVPKPPYKVGSQYEGAVLSDFYEVTTTDPNALERVAMFRCKHHAKFFVEAPNLLEQILDERDVVKAQNAEMLAALEKAHRLVGSDIALRRSVSREIEVAIANAKGENNERSH